MFITKMTLAAKTPITLSMEGALNLIASINPSKGINQVDFAEITKHDLILKQEVGDEIPEITVAMFIDKDGRTETAIPFEKAFEFESAGYVHELKICDLYVDVTPLDIIGNNNARVLTSLDIQNTGRDFFPVVLVEAPMDVEFTKGVLVYENSQGKHWNCWVKDEVVYFDPTCSLFNIVGAPAEQDAYTAMVMDDPEYFVCSENLKQFFN